ncbi:hypothetical protein B0H19DRAFT_328342 [Mycena capillaripes]|nr:hypothetical protein B0H19DRAFT_328342 [Mycena capillaripes]
MLRTWPVTVLLDYWQSRTRGTEYGAPGRNGGFHSKFGAYARVFNGRGKVLVRCRMTFSQDVGVTLELGVRAEKQDVVNAISIRLIFGHARPILWWTRALKKQPQIHIEQLFPPTRGPIIKKK